ncbi:TVP38/TMEM64 family protein [Candidatus Saccharibacteria bacterium]|nr:TVP38/TMEM64 family protein [Candidatus Saccharibacteria bacterium]
MPNKTQSKIRQSLKGLSRKTQAEIVIGTLAVILIIAYIIWDIVAGGPLTQLFSNREELIRIVQGLGPLGPVVYMLLQALQGIVAPIPSNLVGIVGGFLFGWLGVLWTTIGATLGAAVVFWLSRRYGRKLVEKLVKKESLEKFDFVIGKRASLILFLIFIIPGLPDDIVCYVAGLTGVPLKKLILIFALGRLPAVVSNNYIGMGFSGEGNPIVVVIITVVSVLIFAFLYFRQNELLKFLKSKDRAKTSKGKTSLAKKSKNK